MTVIGIDLRTDTVGGSAESIGVLTARRTRVRVDGSVITFPGMLTFPLPGPVDLDPPAAGEAWTLALKSDALYASTIFRTVRFTGQSVAWADLTDVDPQTLQPGTGPAEPAWDAVLDELRARITPTIALSSTAYAALSPPDPETLYLITS